MVEILVLQEQKPVTYIIFCRLYGITEWVSGELKSEYLEHFCSSEVEEMDFRQD